MAIIFMNSENSTKFDFHWLLLNLSDTLDLIRIDRYVALWNLSICYIWKV